MAISQTIHYATLDELYLDPSNPRLGRGNASADQDEILRQMQNWKLDELATSFLVNGQFWINEALLVVEEQVKGKPRKVVVEGNRRLAALMLLRDSYDGNPVSRKWKDIIEGFDRPDGLFEKIPYLLVDSREDVEAFLGFRHVTGIEEWKPAEKAAYIAHMIDDGSMSYREVMRKIGSKTPVVRQHYIAHKLLLQIDDLTDIPPENFDDRFSVMYLSLRTDGVQSYLKIDITGEPDVVNREIPEIHKKNLQHFAMWLFGDEKRDPVFTDSRKVDLFGRVLKNEKAVKYLETSESPKFDLAVQMAGGDELEIEEFVNRASENVQLALTRAHHFQDSKTMQEAVKNFSRDAKQLLDLFPEAKSIVCE